MRKIIMISFAAVTAGITAIAGFLAVVAWLCQTSILANQMVAAAIFIPIKSCMVVTAHVLTPAYALADSDGDHIPNFWEYLNAKNPYGNDYFEPDMTIVAADGSGDYKTLQEAADAAEDGAIILVMGGEYDAPVIYPKNGKHRRILWFGRSGHHDYTAPMRQVTINGVLTILDTWGVWDGFIFRNTNPESYAMKVSIARFFNCQFIDFVAPICVDDYLALEHCTLITKSFPSAALLPTFVSQKNSFTLAVKNSILWDASPKDASQGTPASVFDFMERADSIVEKVVEDKRLKWKPTIRKKKLQSFLPTMKATVVDSIVHGIAGIKDGMDVNPQLTPQGWLTANSPARGMCGLMTSVFFTDIHGYWKEQDTRLDAGCEQFEDSDNDNLPDWWEAANGLDSLEVRDALEDSDGDYFSNITEFLHSTNPQNANSFPEVGIVVAADGTSNYKTLQAAWDAAQDGATIRVKSGDYAGVAMNGTSAPRAVVFLGEKCASPPRIVLGSQGYKSISIGEGLDVTMDGFIIDGAEAAPAIEAVGAKLRLVNCLIRKSALSVLSKQSNLDIVHCTLISSPASETSIATAIVADESSKISILNSILWNENLEHPMRDYKRDNIRINHSLVRGVTFCNNVSASQIVTPEGRLTPDSPASGICCDVASSIDIFGRTRPERNADAGCAQFVRAPLFFIEAEIDGGK